MLIVILIVIFFLNFNFYVESPGTMLSDEQATLIFSVYYLRLCALLYGYTHHSKSRLSPEMDINLLYLI